MSNPKEKKSDAKNPQDEYLTALFLNPKILKIVKSKATTKCLGVFYLHDESIPYGISPKGYVTVWKGDVLNLMESEQEIVRSQIVDVKDRLGKHFTRSQLDGVFVDDEDPN